MIIGLSILVAFATVLAYHGSTRWLSLPSTSSLSAHHVSLSPSPSSSRSFITVMWSYLSSPFLSGINSTKSSSEGRIRGVSVSEGGICTGGGVSSCSPSEKSSSSSLTSSPSVPLLPPLPEMKFSPPGLDVSSASGTAVMSAAQNGKIPKLVLSDDSSSDSEDNGSPPSFPAIHSAQRARPSSATNGSLSHSLTSQHSRYPLAVTRAPSISISHPFNNSSSSTSLSSPPSNSMPPPALPQIRGRNPRATPTTLQFPSRLPSSSYSQSTSVARNGAASNNGLYPSSSGGSSIPSSTNTHLRLPPTTTAPPPKPKAREKAKYSRKIILEPGHSPLDWARLCRTSSPEVLRGPGLPNRLLKVSPSMLAKRGKTPKLSHSSSMNGVNGDLNKAPKINGVSSSTSKKEELEKDETPHQTWTALSGKVYNITAYTPFHPGGEKELLRCAGKDGTDLFMKTHSWVNVEGMLGDCLIGILVSEGEGDEDEPRLALAVGKVNGEFVAENENEKEILNAQKMRIELNGVATNGINGSYASVIKEHGDKIRGITESDTWLDAVD